MHSADEIMSTFLELLENHINKLTIDIWFSDAKAVELRQDCFIIRTSAYKKEIIENRYIDICRKVLSEIFSTEMDLVILDDNQDLPEKKEPEPQQTGDHYSFDNFIVGSSNRFAHAAAYAVAMNPAGAYNPLFIYGGSGLGKTHLMKAISNTISQHHPDYRIVYTKCEDFTNDLIEALHNGTTGEFRSKYRLIDVLLIDDVQFLKDKIQTQEEFFHTFNTLYDAHKQIVLTSDRPPKEISKLQTRLIGRFEMGLLADIQPPDFETKVAILLKKCELFHISIPQNLLNYIATNITSNVRQLEGVINNISMMCSLERINSPTMEIVQRAIKDMQISSDQRTSPEHIIEEVCKFYDISPDSMRSKNQSQNVVLPRQIASYILKELTPMTLEDIGKEFGGQDHTTVLSSIKKIKNKMREDTELASIVKDLMTNLSEDSDLLI